jgi:sialate O-acetylesterase
MRKTPIQFRLAIACLGALGFPGITRADVRLPPVIADGLVLQRGRPIQIFGWADKGEKISVTFRGKTVSTISTANESWKVSLPETTPGGPFTMSIQGKNRIDLKDVYVGDVWVAAGQSNMALDEWALKPDQASPTLRFFNGMCKQYKNWPNDRFGIWTTSGPFSYVGYHFAKEVQKRENVPVGILYAAKGGTAAREWLPKGRANRPYIDFVQPLVPYTIRGVIWWQGENDTWGHNRTEEARLRYFREFSSVINGWRKEWGQGDLPFLYVQLQSRGKSGSFISEPENGPGWQLIRDGQRLAQALPKTAMVVSFDTTPAGKLHPEFSEKKVIAQRLARAAETLAYEKDVEWSGPLFESARWEGDQVKIRFTHVGGGLVAEGGALEDFQIQAGGNTWADVAARIVGDEVVIPVDGLAYSLRVRYGYRAHPTGNLLNKAKLPASPFLTEEIRHKKLK